MDKRALAAGFRERFKKLIDGESSSLAGFLREVGMDRSALSQFLDPNHDRLPRAETLRRIAEARGVSTDWLLCLENAPEGRQTLSSSYKIEEANAIDGSSPLDRWHAEAEGHKLRYVPSFLPDMLDITTISHSENSDDRLSGGTEGLFSGLDLQDKEIEIAMPIQTVQDLANQTGVWSKTSANQCKKQLLYMAENCHENYPALRLHLYDGMDVYSAPFTVFGKLRAAVYIGDAYLVITTTDQVRAFVKRFDHLVRKAIVNPDRAHDTFYQLAHKI